MFIDRCSQSVESRFLFAKVFTTNSQPQRGPKNHGTVGPRLRHWRTSSYMWPSPLRSVKAVGARISIAYRE